MIDKDLKKKEKIFNFKQNNKIISYLCVIKIYICKKKSQFLREEIHM